MNGLRKKNMSYFYNFLSFIFEKENIPKLNKGVGG